MKPNPTENLKSILYFIKSVSLIRIILYRIIPIPRILDSSMLFAV